MSLSLWINYFLLLCFILSLSFFLIHLFYHFLSLSFLYFNWLKWDACDDTWPKWHMTWNDTHTHLHSHPFSTNGKSDPVFGNPLLTPTNFISLPLWNLSLLSLSLSSEISASFPYSLDLSSHKLLKVNVGNSIEDQSSMCRFFSDQSVWTSSFLSLSSSPFLTHSLTLSLSFSLKKYPSFSPIWLLLFSHLIPFSFPNRRFRSWSVLLSSSRFLSLSSPHFFLSLLYPNNKKLFMQIFDCGSGFHILCSSFTIIHSFKSHSWLLPIQTYGKVFSRIETICVFLSYEESHQQEVFLAKKYFVRNAVKKLEQCQEKRESGC